MVSSSAPTRRLALTAAVKLPVNSIPSRFSVLKPASMNVTVYAPGGRLMIWYWPVPSVTAERTRSMSVGLATSTVTPGSTAPDVSVTTPAIDACACTIAGDPATTTISKATVRNPRMRASALDPGSALVDGDYRTRCNRCQDIVDHF